MYSTATGGLREDYGAMKIDHSWCFSCAVPAPVRWKHPEPHKEALTRKERRTERKDRDGREESRCRIHELLQSELSEPLA